MKVGTRGTAVVCGFAALFATSACGMPAEDGSGGNVSGEVPQATSPVTDQNEPPIGQVQQAVVTDWVVGGNALTATGQLGTTSTANFPVEIIVHGVRAVHVEQGLVAPTAPILIAGDVSTHSWGGTSSGSSILGGHGNQLVNTLSSTIGGGDNNIAGTTTSGAGITIGGGETNSATAPDSTIAGGSGNTASGPGSSTVAGGSGNTASGNVATALGGSSNVASGDHSTTVGGASNTASGTTSLAAGQNANANFDGCFVWADDSTTTTLPCGAVNKFVARAAGGTFFYSNAAATAGVKLTAGANAWAAVSDRNAKQDFVPVKPESVLDRVAKMPVSTWTYKSEPGVRHMGPMAQDFRAAFGLGTDDKSIVTVDADGVALAAIQGLNSKVSKLESENENLRRRLDRLEATHTHAAASMFPSDPWALAGIAIGIGATCVVRGRRGPNRR